MTNDKEELKEIQSRLETDYENLGVAIEQLDNEIGYDDEEEVCDINILKKINNDLETWLELIEKSVDCFNDAINKYQKRVMVNNLK